MKATQHLYLQVRKPLEQTVAIGLLILLSPVLLLIAVLVRAKMGSPILFLQERAGKNGKPFHIVKFRTMVPDAEALGGGYLDPTLDLVPPFGEFLRSSSLDELPQLWNIIKGEMAFIGPRPSLVEQYERYSVEQRKRAYILPGVTGLAQVRYRNLAPWSVRIEADLEYLESVSPLTDLRILFATLKNVINRSGIVSDQTKAEIDDLG